MRKLIAAMNMTLDGFCDHTAGIADDELHRYYSDVLSEAGILLYGRKTFQLMEYWQSVVENPTGNKATDDFALMIDKVPKIVYSRTLENITWEGTTLKREINKEEILELKKQAGKDIYLGSPGLIATFSQLDLIDEYWLCIHPIILGKGLVLFKDIDHEIDLKLLRTKTFGSGVVVVCYRRDE